jgi:hypothetical protein
MVIMRCPYVSLAAGAEQEVVNTANKWIKYLAKKHEELSSHIEALGIDLQYLNQLATELQKTGKTSFLNHKIN